MNAEIPAETPAAEVAEVCNRYMYTYNIYFWEGPDPTIIVILDVQNLQAAEAPTTTEAGSCFFGRLQLSKSWNAQIVLDDRAKWFLRLLYGVFV